jgi:potassium inwardly-rectifying channel subfamily J
MFRVGDVRRSHIVGTSIRALLVRSRRTDEGELIPLCQHTIRLQMESGRPSMGGATHLDPGITFLVWPITVVHHINSSSPLWHLSAESLMTGPRFEIIVILEGTIESTGMLAQVSYIIKLILTSHYLHN